MKLCCVQNHVHSNAYDGYRKKLMFQINLKRSHNMSSFEQIKIYGYARTLAESRDSTVLWLALWKWT